MQDTHMTVFDDYIYKTPKMKIHSFGPFLIRHYIIWEIFRDCWNEHTTWRKCREVGRLTFHCSLVRTSLSILTRSSVVQLAQDCVTRSAMCGTISSSSVILAARWRHVNATHFKYLVCTWDDNILTMISHVHWWYVGIKGHDMACYQVGKWKKVNLQQI